MKRGRPTRDLLRSIDVDALARDVTIAANARADELALFLGWRDIPKPHSISACRLASDVKAVHRLALRDSRVPVRDALFGAIDDVERSLRGVDVPAEFTLVVTAARARLTIDAGKAVELAPLAALAGVSLATVRAAVASGALKTPAGAHGRVVRVRAKDARAWLTARGVQ